MFVSRLNPVHTYTRVLRVPEGLKLAAALGYVPKSLVGS